MNLIEVFIQKYYVSHKILNIILTSNVNYNNHVAMDFSTDTDSFM